MIIPNEIHPLSTIHPSISILIFIINNMKDFFSKNCLNEIKASSIISMLFSILFRMSPYFPLAFQCSFHQCVFFEWKLLWKIIDFHGDQAKIIISCNNSTICITFGSVFASPGTGKFRWWKKLLQWVSGDL